MLVLVWLLLLAPLFALVPLWIRGASSSVERLGMFGLTASYLWLLVALTSRFENRLIGAPYSQSRISIPYANVALVVVIVAILVAKGGRKLPILAGTLVVLCWLYVRVISFAV